MDKIDLEKYANDKITEIYSHLFLGIGDDENLVEITKSFGTVVLFRIPIVEIQEFIDENSFIELMNKFLIIIDSNIEEKLRIKYPENFI